MLRCRCWTAVLGLLLFCAQAGAAMAASSVELIDAQGKPATFYLESTRAYVRVQDDAANSNPSYPDTTTVQMTADLSGDQETITLLETGPNSAIFEGSIPLRRGPGLPGNGTLETTASSGAPYRFDTVHATYMDGAGNPTAAVDTIGSITSFRDAYGGEVTSYALDATVHLRVEDHNFNDPLQFDVVNATVQSPGSGDAEGLTLVETGRDTGIFEGSIPARTSPSGSGDGILSAQPGQTILAQHVDANNVLASGAQAAIQSADVRFIEATGEPTVELLENGLARVRVTAPAADANPILAETVTVQLQTAHARDQEDLTLTETGPDTGVFEGSIRLDYSPDGTPHNGALDTGNSNPPSSPLPDEVTATFADATATAQVAGSRVWFIDRFGRTATSFPVGENVGVRLEKPAVNTPGILDQIDNFEIDVPDGNSTYVYYLNLYETGPDTGIFEGSIPSSPYGNGNSVIRALPGFTMKAISWGSFSETLATASAVFASCQVLFLDAQGRPASVYLEGTRAYLRVIDHQRVDSVTVTVSSDVTGDQEEVTLAETSAGSGVFEGSIGLSKSSSGTPDNGVLETGEQTGPVHAFDTLHANYSDFAGGGSSATVETLGYRVWFLDAYGNVVGSYPQGTRAYVRIESHNYVDPNVIDTVTLRLQSAAGDSEYLQVTETGKDTGIFEASIPLDSSGAVSGGDGRLQAQPGTWISADRNSIAPMPVYAWIAAAGVQFIDDAGRPTAEVFTNGAARVRVTSPADNRSSATVESLVAEVSSRYELDLENVTLTETGPDTGVFEGSIQLVYSQTGPLPGNGLLETRNSGDVPPQPEEIKALYEGYAGTAQVAGSRIVFIDGFGRETAAFPVGANVGVRVTEPAANNPGYYDTIPNVQIGVQNGSGTSYYSLTLYETGINTGVFEGSLPSASSSSSSNVIAGAPGRTLTATHSSPYSPLTATAQAVFTGGQVMFADAQGQPASVYLEGTRAYLRVEDHSAAGPRSMQVTTALAQDQETVTLLETSAGSGIFLGSIDLSLSNTPSRGNGRLETGENPGPPFQYETLQASYNDSAGATSTAAATTLGYRIWFLDAYGNVVSSYPQGTRAYVRIELHTFNDPNAIDGVAIQLRSAEGDFEVIQATETGRNTGVFEGSIPLATGTVGASDGVLQASPGSWISADRSGITYSMPVYASIGSAAVQFIGDAGRPATEVLAYGTGRVRVVSPADNHNSLGVEMVGVQVSSRYKQDAELVTLTETGPNTGIFEGSIPLVYTQSNAIPNDGQLEIGEGGGNPPAPEEATATFDGLGATATVIGSRVVFIDDFGRETATFPVGANVGVRLVEPASNHAPVYETVYNFEIGVQYDAGLGATGTSYYSLDLNETGPDTGVFEGRMPSSTAGSGPYVILAAPGRIVKADHVNPYSPAVASARATFTDGEILFVDDQGKPAGVYLEGTRAYIRVEDHQAYSPLTVSVTAELSGDQETVTLQSTGAGSGIFTGSIDLSLSNTAAPDNGRLETGEAFGPPFQYETIRASYTGAPSTATATTLGYRVSFLDASGAVVTSYLQGSRAYVRLEDHNYNNPNQIDTLYVQLNSSTGDQEYLQVTETGAATGIYEGSIPLDLAAVAVGDGRLQAPAGGEITADRQGAWFPAPVHAGIDAAAVEFTDEAGAKTTEVLENGTARVRVSSPQDNLNPAAADSIVVQLRSRYGNDQETLTLTETGPDTGVFEGSIRLRFNSTPGGCNGTLETALSPGYGPDEITATYGAYNATAHDVLEQLAFLNLRGQVVSSYPVRSRINIRVLDAIQNNPAQVDTLQVDLQSLGMDYESVWVTETGPDTGVFLGSISSTEQPGSYGDGVLTAPAGQQLTIQSYTLYGLSPAAQATITSFVAPQAQDDSAELVEGTRTAIDVLANDVSTSGPLTIAQYTQPQHGSVTIDSQGMATITSALGYSGPDSFTYLAVDPQGGEALASVALTITPANRPPVAVDDVAQIDEDTATDIDVLANDSDPDGNTLSLQLPGGPAHGYLSIQPGNLIRYTPDADYNGTDSFTYEISDGSFTATATVSITIRPVNDPPVAADDIVRPLEDTPTDLDLLANDNDVDGDPLAVVSVTQPAHGTAVINPDNRTVRYTPAANFDGNDEFYYTVSDGTETRSALVTVWMQSVNDDPVAVADSVTVVEDTPTDLTLLLNNDTDVDDSLLSVSSFTQGTHGTVQAGQPLRYTPAPNYSGPDSFTYTVTDGHGGFSTATVTVTVTPVNDPPVAAADTATVAEDGNVNINALGNDTDADGDTLSVTAVTQGAHGTVVINPDKTVKYTPAANYNGPDSFTYTVSDGNGGTATGTVTITVTSVNDAPTANADAATVTEDGAVNITVLANDTDPEGDVLSVVSVTQGAHGAVAINPDKTVRYTPAANYNGPDAFTYTISDGNGGTSSAAVTVSVTAVNDPPVAVNDSATVVAGSTTTVSVLANDADVDGPGLSVTSVTQGARGTVVINPDQTVTYTASLYVGTDSFTYTVSDGAGGTATATVSVNLTAPARVSTGIQARYDFNEGSGSTVNDTSGVGTPLNLTIASPSSVSWISGGLKVNTATAISTSGVASKIISAAQSSNALTVEAWVTPSSLTLTGPARIATITKNATQKNLIFGQSGSRYETQLKTSTGTASLQSPASSLTQALTHVVYTRASSGQAVWYINGVQVSTQTTTGNLSTWGTDQKLTLSDNWQGSYFLLAVYGRALTASEVQQNYLAGADAN